MQDNNYANARSRSTPPKCTSPHEGKTILNEVIPMHIDELFTKMYTPSQFFYDFHESRCNTDVVPSEWTNTGTPGSKTRTINMIMAIRQSLGPKSSIVEEIQTILPCTVPGFLYAVNAETSNRGIPYAENFYISLHTCLERISNTQTSFLLYGQLKYRKSTWAVIKTFIEKNAFEGIFEFYRDLAKELHKSCEIISPHARKVLRKRKTQNRLERLKSVDKSPNKVDGFNFKAAAVYITFILVLMLNIFLYNYLNSMENSHVNTKTTSQSFTHEEKLRILQKYGDSTSASDNTVWAEVLDSSIELINQLEKSLYELRKQELPKHVANAITMPDVPNGNNWLIKELRDLL